MNTLWIENARAQFVRVYGQKRGLAVCNVVMPAVMGDFRKTVLNAEPGAAVTEQYRTDDRKTDVRLTGHKELRNGREACVVEKIEIGDIPVCMGEEYLIL